MLSVFENSLLKKGSGQMARLDMNEDLHWHPPLWQHHFLGLRLKERRSWLEEVPFWLAL
jgi:hypothetical protein